MTFSFEQGSGQPQDPETLRLETLRLGQALIRAVQAGESFAYWDTAVFPESVGLQGESIVLGYQSHQGSWDRNAKETSLTLADSFMLSLDGRELHVDRLSRRPHPAGMEMRAIHSTVTPDRDSHPDNYDVISVISLNDMDNQLEISPLGPYNINKLFSDLSAVQHLQGQAVVSSAQRPKKHWRRYFGLRP